MRAHRGAEIVRVLVSAADALEIPVTASNAPHDLVFFFFCDNTHRIKTKPRFSTERKQSDGITSANSSEHPEADHGVEAAGQHLRKISRIWMDVSMVWGSFVREKEFEAWK
jgi:hypothetical protein